MTNTAHVHTLELNPSAVISSIHTYDALTMQIVVFYQLLLMWLELYIPFYDAVAHQREITVD